MFNQIWCMWSGKTYVMPNIGYHFEHFNLKHFNSIQTFSENILLMEFQVATSNAASDMNVRSKLDIQLFPTFDMD